MTKKAIGISEFSHLAEPVQLEMLHREGVHVGKRNMGGQTVILFQLYGFYVELHYVTYRREVDHLVISENTDILAPYLDQIRIRDLDKDKSED